ncbi:hypothetical protein WJM97_04990 [Okeanomitos corallinicola TIOX110]|uniref:Uncharacterized protein n=1 Tax=Okeanomitos corallinicola TIOX110 TaxID=3133117 RepID=A0ABZ2V040_9CYAN
MNRKFVLALLSSPVLFMSILSTVMIARSAYANPVVIPVGTHLSCIRSPHSATIRQTCIAVADTTKPAIEIAQAQVENKQNPTEPEELIFTEAESDEAIKLFGCDCPACLSAVRQLHGLPPLPV